MLYERRGTSVLCSARPELVVPTPWTSRLWTEVPDSSLWPRACSATGLRASMRQSRVPRFRPAVLGGLLVLRTRVVLVERSARLARLPGYWGGEIEDGISVELGIA